MEHIYFDLFQTNTLLILIFCSFLHFSYTTDTPGTLYLTIFTHLSHSHIHLLILCVILLSVSLFPLCVHARALYVCVCVFTHSFTHSLISLYIHIYISPVFYAYLIHPRAQPKDAPTLNSGNSSYWQTACHSRWPRSSHAPLLRRVPRRRVPVHPLPDPLPRLVHQYIHSLHQHTLSTEICFIEVSTKLTFCIL